MQQFQHKLCHFVFLVGLSGFFVSNINVLNAAASPKELTFTIQLCRNLVLTTKSLKDDFIYRANSDYLANQSDL